MSRIGNLPVQIPQKVEVAVDKNNLVTVKGPKGNLTQQIDSSIKVEVADGNIKVSRSGDEKRVKAMHGLYRALLNNMVTGVSKGFKIEQELVGVGYKASMAGTVLELSLGYSHNIFLSLPKEVTATAVTEKGKSPIITLESIDKQLIGQVAAKIRSLRKVEPYKGKGIRFSGEYVRRKAGKAAAK